jgi:succinate dehydrogenase / fumarate reductase iron-sulfur subunit
MNFTLHVWRQAGRNDRGQFVRYEASDISSDMSFLEMLDVVNEQLIARGERPIAFDSDCREGICGTCGMVINGVAHGPQQTATCQLHMRSFRDGDVIYVEPWRARAFPIVKDLVVNRSALDRIIAAGGYVSVSTGSAPEANTILVPKPAAESALDAAACIGCGACVAACPNAAAHLYSGAKLAHLARLPQGQPERWERAWRMVEQMEAEGFGSCTNYTECEAVCPAHIRVDVIARLNCDHLRAKFKPRSV